MFFIAGTEGETSTVQTGEFYCPECQDRTIYHHNQVHEVATVFFVSVANLRLLGEYIECQSCGNTYEMDILDYDPEQEQRDFEALYLSGLKTVMSMMMSVDGNIDENEKGMMKDIYEKITDSELSDSEIEREIEFCRLNPIGLEKCLNELFPVLNESGRETVIKVAYWISIADGKADEEEIKLLKKMATRFQISSAHLKGIILEVNELASE